MKRLQDYKSKKSKPAERTEKPEKMESKNVSIKIISAGNQETGKSCIIKRYCEGRFVKRYIPTIGVDYGVKKIEHKGYNVAVNFFDLSGAEEFKEIRTDFYKDAQAILLVYDISDKESFKNLHFWEDEIKSKGLDTQKIKTVLIGNKSDAGSREIQTSEGSKWAKSRGFNFYEVSCSTGQNISDAFTNVLDELMNQHIASKKLLG